MIPGTSKKYPALGHSVWPDNRSGSAVFPSFVIVVRISMRSAFDRSVYVVVIVTLPQSRVAFTTTCCGPLSTVSTFW